MANPDRLRGARKDSTLWLMSFSDLVLALLCFFVLMVSTMTPSGEGLQRLNAAFTAKEASTAALPQLVDELGYLLVEEIGNKRVSVELRSQGILVEFNDELVFSSGSAQISPEFLPLVRSMAIKVKGLGPRYGIDIRGHTDDLALSRASIFKSNWALSAARAIALLEQFVAAGVATERLKVSAFAHTRPKVGYHQLSGQKLEQARRKNRRVGVLVSVR